MERDQRRGARRPTAAKRIRFEDIICCNLYVESIGAACTVLGQRKINSGQSAGGKRGSVAREIRKESVRVFQGNFLLSFEGFSPSMARAMVGQGLECLFVRLPWREAFNRFSTAYFRQDPKHQKKAINLFKGKQ